uniref:Vitellogenin-1 n=1 Tax=Cacopsylla melanoneura TaxID=428564 RepID=A0A8D9A635_9HEMI
MKLFVCVFVLLGVTLAEHTEEQLESRSGGQSYSSRTKVVEQGNQICFSAKPLPVCSEGYQPEDTTEKYVDFVCVNNDQQARQWREQARSGEHISALRRKNPNKSLTVEIPTKCIAV